MSTLQPSVLPTAGPTQPFTYLGGGVAIVFCIYGVIGVISLLIYLKYYQNEVYEFKTAYECTIKRPYMVVLLGCYRCLCFVFFLFFAGVYVWVVIFPGSLGGKNYQYFTYWNVGMAFFYYLIATIASFLGYYYHIDDNNQWTVSIVYFGKIHRIFFSVAGSTAFFITVVNFVLLSDEDSFSNISDHLMTSLTFLVEMFLCTTTVPVYNLFYMISWAIVWISFILIIYPGTGALNGWPYFFLYSYTSAVYFWYPILILLMVVFYFIWYGLSKLKVKYIINPSLHAAESNVNKSEENGYGRDNDNNVEYGIHHTNNNNNNNNQMEVQVSPSKNEFGVSPAIMSSNDEFIE